MSNLPPAPIKPFPLDPETFDTDDRISYSTVDKKFLLVDTQGDEYEFDDVLKRWVPILDEDLMAQQAAAYKVEGVNEEETVEEARKRKREEARAWVNGEDEGGRAVKPASKKQKKAPGPPRQNTAVYVTGLPLDVTIDEVAEVFSRKCGVIAEEIDSGRPRIKLYSDEKGNFKGDALIVFFKAPSVQMAITLLDDTEFRFGNNGGSGRMRVMAADSSYKKVRTPEDTSNGGANAEVDDAAKEAKREAARKSARDKAKIIKKTQKLDARLADWSDDEDVSTMPGTGTGFGGRKPLKTVILKHMFTLSELEEDPAAILDIKEDIREECAKLGNATNVVLYDEEESGVVSVKFKEEEAASECVRLMNGRAFDGRVVQAYLSDGKEKFRRSGKGKMEDEEDD